MKRVHIILAAATLAALLLAVQAFPQAAAPQVAAKQAPGGLAGKVVSSTSKDVVRKATLTLLPQSGNGGTLKTATSDGEGKFRFTDIAPGLYILNGSHAGYATSTYGVDQPQTPIAIAAGQTVTVEFKLVPHSVIKGRVFDADGDPVEGASVTVSRYSYPSGVKQLVRVAEAETNDIGAYRIANLTPGRYYVSAANADRFDDGGPGGRGPGGRGPGGPPGGFPDGGRGGFGQAAQNVPNPDAYLTTYYPDTIEPSGDNVLDLAPGSEAAGIDIRLRKGRTYSISGVVDGLPPAPVQPLQTQNPAQGQANNKGNNKGFANGNDKGNDFFKGKGNFPGNDNGQGFQPPQGFVDLTPKNGGQTPGADFGGGSPVRNDGSFEITGVLPGSYYLTAQGRGGQDGNDLSARLSIEVNGDMNGVRLRLAPPVAVSGVVHTEPTNLQLNLKQIRVAFTSQSGQDGGFGRGGRGRGGPGGRGGGGGGRPAEVNDQGKFTTQLDVDTYQVVLQQAPNNVYLKAVNVQGKALPNNVLDMSSPPAGLEIVIASGAGPITGKVEASKGTPAGNARVTVVPSDLARRDLFRSTNSALDGTFTVQGMPPGTYRVFAWLDVDQNAWMDADYRKPYEAQSATVEISNGKAPALTLGLIKPQDGTASEPK
jgi:hypothetical protein